MTSTYKPGLIMGPSNYHLKAQPIQPLEPGQLNKDIAERLRDEERKKELMASIAREESNPPSAYPHLPQQNVAARPVATPPVPGLLGSVPREMSNPLQRFGEWVTSPQGQFFAGMANSWDYDPTKETMLGSFGRGITSAHALAQKAKKAKNSELRGTYWDTVRAAAQVIGCDINDSECMKKARVEALNWKREGVDDFSTKKLLGASVKQLTDLGDASRASESMATTADRILQLSEMGVETGYQQDFINDARRLYNRLTGRKASESLGGAELMASLSTEWVLDLTSRLKGPISEKELAFLKQIPADNTKTPLGIRMIAESVKIAAEGDREIYHSATETMSNGGNLFSADYNAKRKEIVWKYRDKLMKMDAQLMKMKPSEGGNTPSGLSKKPVNEMTKEEIDKELREDYGYDQR